ncbi:MAG: hypothetical protein KHZ90_09585 [Veillonella parvula]|uniref:Uncharacterized protein n=1 Tax=Veillonella parvula TaxID=29466 RepID=A0A942WNS6_VEIPA|nr:hypothetical protein [Veillonella parvula]MBS4894006.1 hypothetical protein [Veillonella parvula]
MSNIRFFEATTWCKDTYATKMNKEDFKKWLEEEEYYYDKIEEVSQDKLVLSGVFDDDDETIKNRLKKYEYECEEGDFITIDEYVYKMISYKEFLDYCVKNNYKFENPTLIASDSGIV